MRLCLTGLRTHRRLIAALALMAMAWSVLAGVARALGPGELGAAGSGLAQTSPAGETAQAREGTDALLQALRRVCTGDGIMILPGEEGETDPAFTQNDCPLCLTQKVQCAALPQDPAKGLLLPPPAAPEAVRIETVSTLEERGRAAFLSRAPPRV